MATTHSPRERGEIIYRESDGRPMGETPIHRRNISHTIEMLDSWYAADPMVYVSGNMFLYYAPGDRYASVVPDVFVVKGIPKLPERRVYLTWREGKVPDVIVEFTSESSREEDMEDKFELYRDKLQVPEYFVFDPEADYLDPPLQGFRLVAGQYQPIKPVDGRLPSEVLALHLERQRTQLRLYDPILRQWLPTPQEEKEARINAETAWQREAEARQREAEARQREAEARRQGEAEIERLRQELDALKQRRQGPSEPR
jgi:Uma2 family endonuclease